MICMHGNEIDLEDGSPLDCKQCIDAMRRYLVIIRDPDKETLRVVGDFIRRMLEATKEE